MADWFSEPRPDNGGTYLRVARPALLAAGVLLMAGVRLGAATPDPGKVTSIRFWSLGDDMTRIAVEVSSDFTFKSERLSGPERMFFDIRGAKPEMR